MPLGLATESRTWGRKGQRKPKHTRARTHTCYHDQKKKKNVVSLQILNHMKFLCQYCSFVMATTECGCFVKAWHERDPSMLGDTVDTDALFETSRIKYPLVSFANQVLVGQKDLAPVMVLLCLMFLVFSTSRSGGRASSAAAPFPCYQS